MILLFCIIGCNYLAIAQSAKKPLLRHVVLFSFTKNATSKDIQTIEKAFAQLPITIKLIKNFEWGVNSSPENLNDGLTHCFFVTFTSEKDRDAYLIHPNHKAFVKIAQPFIDKVVVVDYWIK